ncbi:DUF418 domain-containing protein [Rhodobium gokarnense]|uniref:DUF418 domain-containing protein n=1 Tax=Rhodobium gokarnense TaxID=364296 RepID=A0ABT3H8P3_9HYPH|nr:DUF418 domain-containing protein [Rhodobium gokarnense]MCW2306777.1 uncharacterized protein [Rhodobium gokarnense]
MSAADIAEAPLGAGIARAAARTGGRTNAAERIGAMDAVRGFAVCGILIRNIFVFAIPGLAYSLPLMWGGDEMADLQAWGFVELFVDGSMRALFSLLFGATALLLLQKADSGGLAAVDYFYRRLMWLMLFGLVHAYLLLSPVDILFVYGCLGLMIFPLRNLRPRTLLIVAGAGLAVTALLSTLEWQITEENAKQANAGTVIEAAQPVQPATFVTKAEDGAGDAPIVLIGSGTNAAPADEAAEPDEETQAEEDATEAINQSWIADVADRREGYLYNLVTSAGTAFANHSTDLFKTHLVDVGALILIGMAFFKLGIVTGARSTRFYLMMLMLGYGVGVTVNGMEIMAAVLPAEEAGSTDWTSITYDLGRIGNAFGHLSLIVLLTRLPMATVFTSMLKATGRLALTNYLLQTMVFTGLFFGYGFGLYGSFSHSQLLLMAFAMIAVQLVGSRLYLMAFSQGPFEWLLRRLIVWKSAKPALTLPSMPPKSPATAPTATTA